MNTYIIHDARLTADPEAVNLQSGKTLTKFRVADNAPGKKDEARPPRFVTCKLFGAQATAALRLRKGDVVSVTGPLGVEKFKGKDGSDRTADVMLPTAFRVQKSETFFEAKPGEAHQETEPGAAEELFR